MSDRHVHRFTQFERRKKGLAGMLGRTELVLACGECSMTTEEYAEQTASQLYDLEQRIAGFDHGDGVICEDDHPKGIGFGGAPPGSMPPCP